MIEASMRGAWQELEGTLRPFIARRLANSSDVDDVMQDVFLRMQRGLAGLREEERFGPWVYRVARSAIVDHQRSSSRHRVAQGADAGALAEDIEGAAEAAQPELDDDLNAVEREMASYLAPFIAMLPSPYREALTLTELQGLTQKQAAELLGISVSGAKSRVQRGRVVLRQALEDCCHIALDRRGRVISCEPRPDGKLPEGCCGPSPGGSGSPGGCSAS